MAYNFLTLTNDVCKRLNEVELSEQDFAGTVGVHSQIKDSINYAIRDINQLEYEWPFNLVTQTLTLTPGQPRYSFPADFKTASMDTFRIHRNDTFGNESRILKPLLYEEYLTSFIDQDFNTAETIRALPEYVFRTPDLGFALAETPDKAYQLTYEYYSLPADLVGTTDVPTVPEQFRRTIVDGAMFYNYMFRSDVENTQITQQKFREGLDHLRQVYINRFDYIKSTMIERRPYPSFNERIG